MTSQAARVRLALTYEDGATDIITVKPYGIVAAERHFGSDMPQVEGGLYAAWAQMRAAGSERTGDDFNAWLQTLVGIEQVEGPDPTDAAYAAD